MFPLTPPPAAPKFDWAEWLVKMQSFVTGRKFFLFLLAMIPNYFAWSAGKISTEAALLALVAAAGILTGAIAHEDAARPAP